MYAIIVDLKRRGLDKKKYTKAEETELLQRAGLGDMDARQNFIDAQLWWVANTVIAHYRNNEHVEDLIQCANLHLLKLMQSFDVDKGVRFSTYAQAPLLGHVWCCYLLLRGGVCCTGSSLKLAGRVRREFDAMVAEGQSIEQAEIALAQRVMPKDKIWESLSAAAQKRYVARVRTLLAATVMSVSLDAPCGPDGDMSSYDVIPDVRPNPEEKAIANEEVAALREAIARLKPQYQRVVIYANGLFGYTKLSIAQIAEMMGVSRQRVNAIHQRAMELLRIELCGGKDND